MTMGETAKVAQAFALTAAYYRVKIEDQVLKMYAEDVADLSFEDVIRALGNYRRDPKNRQMPLPAQIRDMIEPVQSNESQAKEIAAKINGAIVKFGHPNESLAKQYIGEIGWAIVQRWGGWAHLCAHMGLSIDPGQFYAQIRDHAVDVVRRPDSIEPFPTALPPSQSHYLLSGETMPDGEPVQNFEMNRQEQLKKLFEDMERRKRDLT